ncbi:MAG: hypothetical protein BWY83_02003 [bacterium ADurb.Bin478]|nr:MAG: hypothetical protein BWY83_02003 [bacterium ADurb.Bin478]
MAGRHFDADLQHQLAEFFPVFSCVNGCNIHADHAHIVLLPDTQFICFLAQVQRCLATHGRQYRINLVFFQDLFNTLHGQGQQVYFVSHHGVSHNGGRIAVDQDYFDPFFPQAAGSL